MAGSLRTLDVAGARLAFGQQHCSDTARRLLGSLWVFLVFWLGGRPAFLQSAPGRLLLLASPVLGYLALAFLVNETRLIVRGGALEISQGPVPTGRGAVIPASRIEQVLVRRVERRSRVDASTASERRHGRPRRFETRSRIVYELRLLPRGGGDPLLLASLDSEDEARQAARELEQALAAEGHPSAEQPGSS